MEEFKSLDDLYTYVNHKKMRFGYTTGSCAAAAARAASCALLCGQVPETVSLLTPAGVMLRLEVAERQIVRNEHGQVTKVVCGIHKDGGDDVDHTSGALICAEVSLIREHAEEIEIEIDGGRGVGRVTRPGLDQPIGNAAINSVPRQMIRENVLEVCQQAGFQGSLRVIIFVPEGAEIAKKTFNANLGIVDGISILGTSGIVKPMSKEALIDSMRVEMNSLYEQGKKHLMISPGNYGEEFSKLLGIHDLSYFMQCSNYVGETMDMAEEIGVESILFVAHIGKFIKVAGGIMNTHSANADARMEILAAEAIRAGADLQVARDILNSNTTEDGLTALKKAGQDLFDRCMGLVVEKIQYHLKRRSGGRIETGLILFSSQHGKLAVSGNAEAMIRRLDSLEFQNLKSFF